MLREHKQHPTALTPSAELLLDFILKNKNNGNASDTDTDEEPTSTSRGSKPKVKNVKRKNEEKPDAGTAHKNRSATSNARFRNGGGRSRHTK